MYRIKKIVIAVASIFGVFLGSFCAAQATTILFPGGGGTGWGYPGGIQAHTVLIGEGVNAIATATPSTAGYVLTSNGVNADPTFQAATGGGSSFSYPFPSNATSTSINFSGGIQVGSLSGFVGANNGTLYSFATSSITTLSGLSLPYSQLTGVPAFDTFGYPFPSNATSTNLTFSNGITLSNLSAGTVNSTGSGTLYSSATTTLAGTGIVNVSNAPYVFGSSPSVVSLTGGTGGQILGWLNGIPTWTATTTFNSPLTYANGSVSCATCNTTNATVSSIATNNGITGGTITTTGTIGLATINAGVLGAVTNSTVPTSQATSTLYGTGVGGQVLAWNNGQPQWVATSSINNGVSSLTAGSGISLSGSTGAVTVTNAIGYPFPANATTTGLGIYASTTIGNNTAAGGLTVSGGATTTGNAYVAGNDAIGVQSLGGGTNSVVIIGVADGNTGLAIGTKGGTPRFAINTLASGGWTTYDYSNSTYNAGLTQLAGNVGVGSTTPGSLLSIGGSGAGINLSTATSTFTNVGGINLTAGCYAINGTCLSTGGSGSGTVGSGTTGQFPYYAANGTTLTATSTIFVNTAGNVGIGTTTPGANLSIYQSSSGAASTHGIQFSGNSIGGTSSGDGFLFSLGYNTSGNKQIWFGDPDYAGSSSGTFFRLAAISGGMTLDAVAGDNSVRRGLNLGDTGDPLSNVVVNSGLGVRVNPQSSDAFDVNGSATIGATYAGNNAAPTNGLLVQGKIGIGTTSPFSTLSVASTTQSSGFLPVFTAASTTNATLFTVLGNGNVGVGTSTPGSLLSIGNTTNTTGINFTTSTSTFTGVQGINLTSGCYAINGTCLSTSGGTSGLTSYDAWTHPAAGQSATTSLMLFYGNASTTQFTATSSTYLATSAGGVAIGESSDQSGQKLEVNGNTALLGNFDEYSSGIANQYYFITPDGTNGFETGAYNSGFVSLEVDGAPLNLNSRAANTVNVGSASNLSNLDVFGTASTSALKISSITGSTQCLQVNSTGVVSGTGSACGAGGSSGISDPFTHTSVWAQTTSATSTLLSLTGSPYSLVASSTAVISALDLGSSTATSFTNAPLVLYGNTNNFTQAVIGNLSSGNNASADVVVNNNLSTNTTYYGDFGINSSGYSQSTYSGEAANDVYMQSSDSNLDLEAASTTGNFGINFFTGGVTSSNLRANILKGGFFNIGTTTSALSSLTIASSTAPQLDLGAGAGVNLWDMRVEPSGVLDIGTTTVAGTATTTIPAIEIGNSGAASLSIGSSTMTFGAVTGLLTLGANSTSGGGAASSTISAGKIQIDGYSNTGSRICMFVVGTTLTVVSGACTP